MVDDRVVKSADFIYALNHSIFTPLCLVLVRAPYQSAGLPDGFSRESHVFCVLFYFILFFLFIFFFFFFFATHSFVISYAREIIKL